MPSTSDINKELALVNELRTSIRLIQIGLKSLQRIDGGNDFYHMPFLLLANGLERLLKGIYIFHILETTSKFPMNYPWEKNKKGHDLIFLLNLITSSCISSEYISKVPVGAKDYAFLTTDTDLRNHLEILSSFGMADRYYNLDLIKGIQPGTESPEREWGKLESEISMQYPETEKTIMEDPNGDAAYKRINTAFVIRFEKMARALCRLFTIGKLGEKAKQHSSIVLPFLMLRDEELGTTEY